ncbi:response regulator transcription factor [Marinobacter sp.]|uniref:response regulator transcription factor n=1 Tax=Marinobacter sp. TaxID=50741 RepID=UPI003564ECD4
MTPANILITEDSVDLCIEMVDFFNFYGFNAEGANNVAEMREKLQTSNWHVLILDLNLPDGDGVAVARQLRQTLGLNLGIIMVTARGQLEDRIAGLTVGADAYMVKPVNLPELKAQTDQLVARLQAADFRDSTPRWHLDTTTLTLHAPGGGTVGVTSTEAKLLELLMQTPHTPVTREQLCQALPPSGQANDTRRLDSVLSRLRSNIARETGEALPVHTFRNRGYAFAG